MLKERGRRGVDAWQKKSCAKKFRLVVKGLTPSLSDQEPRTRDFSPSDEDDIANGSIMVIGAP